MLQFDQTTIEGRLDKCFPFESLTQLAVIAGVNASQLAQELNPNDIRKSPAYRFLKIQCALDDYDPELGEQHWQDIQRFRDASRPISSQNLCVDAETAKAIKEDADCAIEHAKGSSLFDQLAEVNESIAQKHKQKAAILEAINNEKESYNGGTTRYAAPPVRDQMRQTVASRRNGR